MTHDKNYEAQRSLGFTWAIPVGGFQFEQADGLADALFTFHKYRVEHVSKTLQTLEHIPCTYAQTRTILDGKAVQGLTTRQLRAIENYGKACELLVDMLESKNFTLTKDCFCQLHELVAKDEAKHVGRFRGHEVRIEQSHYIPPQSAYLDAIFNEGIAYLASLKDTQERASSTFLFMARSQFFSDCNKRTASLIMNGILMQGGFQPISIHSDTFIEKLANFYESGNATEVIQEINNIASQQYVNNDVVPSQTKLYTQELYTIVEEKTSQAARIERRLDKTIEEQQKAISKLQENKPNRISWLWRGHAWTDELHKKVIRLEALRARHVKLRTICQKIESLSRQKLQRREPELVASFHAQEMKKRQEKFQQIKNTAQTSHTKAKSRKR